jgi:O-antigen ligase
MQPSPQGAPQPASPGRARWALPLARWAALVVVIGAGVTPPLLNIALGVLVIAFFALPDWAARLAGLRRQPMFAGWAVLVAVLVLAALWGLVRGVEPARVGMGLVGWRILLLIPLVLALFDEPQAQRHFAFGVVIFAVVGALGSLVAIAVGFTKIEPYPGVILRNQVTQAMIFAAGALIALALAALDQRLSPRRRLVLALAGGLLLAVLVFLQSGRSGFVAFAAAAMAVLLVSLRGRQRIGALLALPLVIALLFAASPRLQERFAMGAREVRNVGQLTENTSLGIRVVIWQTTVELIEARPLLGYGLGGYAPAYAMRIAQKHTEGWRAIVTVDPHNQYLYVWAEAGLMGLLAFLGFLVALWRQRPPTPCGAIGVGLMLGWCATSLFSSHFQTFNESHLIAMFVGVFLARERLGLLQPTANGDSVIDSAAANTSA